MAQKWNLQDIRPAGARKAPQRPEPQQSAPRLDISARRPRPEPSPELVPDPDVATIDIVDGKSARRKRTFISLIIVVSILAAGFFVNTLMGGAEITVYPKYKDVNVQATFTAHKEPQVGELSYELLTLEATGERQVTAKGQEKVSERATGKILIYNAFSSAPQRLIKNTRFETPDGLVFRITESVEIPGTSKDAGGNAVPGVVSADVFADGTGEQYNIKPTRFTVPGLKGSDQYDKVYAESTIDFTGGYEGMKYVIDEAEYKTAKQAAQLELRNALLARLDKERPAGFVVYGDAVTFAYDSLPATEYNDGMATVKERARLQVPMFAHDEFAGYLADKTIEGFEESPVEMPDPMTLTFTYENATATVSDISKYDEIEFTLKGNARIIWTFDAERLKHDVAAKAKTALPTIITGYPALSKFEAKITPFWSQSFPEDISKITVTRVVGESDE